MSSMTLQSFRMHNFKAVRDSKRIRFTPLTVFIGNNGSGKSSILEGLETLQFVVADGLDRAMQVWRGLEHIRNQSVPHQRRTAEPRDYETNPIRFSLRGSMSRGSFSASMEINSSPGGNEIFIQHERVAVTNADTLVRDSRGVVSNESGSSEQAANGGHIRGSSVSQSHGAEGSFVQRISDGESILDRTLGGVLSAWQFVSLQPEAMGSPVPRRRTTGSLRLERDGSNVAEYLLQIRNLDQGAFDGIVETLQYVLPYARDVQPTLTSELERMVYLQMTEQDFKVPGWLLSTGTLRILALLALLRHPKPAPLIAVEEIENGLDPRTINLLVEEMRTVVESGRSQLIVTTHSPYLLDLLSLSHIVLVERVNGEPTFTRPAAQQHLETWAKDFSPGRLYTMDRLHSKSTT